jgi:membrane protease YdiL (CAAX protease family)
VFVLLEPLLMFGLILAYIWRLRVIHPYYGIAIPALMFVSHLLRRESPRSLGFQLHNLRVCLIELAKALIPIAILMLLAGVLFGTLRQIGFEDVLLAVAAYLPWGLAQQYALNGYFLNRFDAVLPRSAASLLAASLFCAVHVPNPFLMAVTLPAGWLATLVYRRTRTLYLLGIAHAVIGLLLYFVAPDSLSHHMRVGPGWWRGF